MTWYASALTLWAAIVLHWTLDAGPAHHNGRLRSICSLAATLWATGAPFVALAVYIVRSL